MMRAVNGVFEEFADEILCETRNRCYCWLPQPGTVATNCLSDPGRAVANFFAGEQLLEASLNIFLQGYGYE